MTNSEKEILKQEILAELTKAAQCKVVSEDVQSKLKPAREYFFGGMSAKGRSVFKEKLGPFRAYKVWEDVRKLTCTICGVSYVRNIQNTELANEIAIALGELILQSVIKYEESVNRREEE